MASTKPLRILCLHGHGTNSRIFKDQTTALRNEVGGGIEWRFAEGGIPTPKFHTLKDEYPEDEECFSFVDMHDTASVARAMENINDFVTFEGPFDIVVAQCATASLMAALLMRQAEEKPAEPPLFKGAVFFSTFPVLNVKALKGWEFLEDAATEFPIAIPTANVWSANEKMHAELAPQIADLCAASTNINYIHSSGNGIPTAIDELALLGAAQAVKSTIDLAVTA